MAQGFARSEASHDEAHAVASHSDTTATGSELETLTDGSNADALHAHAASAPALDDVTDVTITAVAEDEVLAKSAGDWINRTLAEAGIEAAGTAAAQDHDHATPIATHAALPNAHHNEAHSISSHDDTTATGAELETLTDGSNADALHVHADDGLDLTTKGDLHGYDTGQARIPVGANNERLVADSAQGLGVKWAAETEFIVFGETGDLTVKTGTHRFYLPYNVTIVEVEISVGAAPTGAAAIVDVNVNGTTIFTTQTNRPEIAISGFVNSSTTIEDDDHTDGQYLTVDVDQIGSTIAGADLTVVVRYEKT